MDDGVRLQTFKRRLAYRLLAWSAISVAAGALLVPLGSALWRGFGIQAALWGAVDAVIALVGLRQARRGSRAAAERWEGGGGRPHGTSRDGAGRSVLDILEESGKLRRLLYVNAGLDVLYVAAGLCVALLLGTRGAGWIGHGWGVVVQGGFLLLFDLVHARAVPQPRVDLPDDAFGGPEHASFVLRGGEPTAVLVHGFPGTPDEMRPLARALNAAGWTVSVPLLPGFGAEISTLMERDRREWIDRVAGELRAQRADGRPLVLIGYSMGASIAVAAADAVPVDRLVLIAPFWRLGTVWQTTIGRILRPVLPPAFRPLEKADFGDPEDRHALSRFFPSVDFDDAGQVDRLRGLSVPLAFLAQLHGLGERAYRTARRIPTPALVVQGARDEVSRSSLSRRLAARFKGGAGWVEIDAGHDLLDDADPHWEELVRSVRTFTDAALRSSSTAGYTGV